MVFIFHAFLCTATVSTSLNCEPCALVKDTIKRLDDLLQAPDSLQSRVSLNVDISRLQMQLFILKCAHSDSKDPTLRDCINLVDENMEKYKKLVSNRSIVYKELDWDILRAMYEDKYRQAEMALSVAKRTKSPVDWTDFDSVMEGDLYQMYVAYCFVGIPQSGLDLFERVYQLWHDVKKERRDFDDRMDCPSNSNI